MLTTPQSTQQEFFALLILGICRRYYHIVIDSTTKCRVKRHLFSTASHKHGSHAETRPAIVICAQGQELHVAKIAKLQKLTAKVQFN
jgi:hypothetical protein